MLMKTFIIWKIIIYSKDFGCQRIYIINNKTKEVIDGVKKYGKIRMINTRIIIKLILK